MNRLEAIRARERAATRGPWRIPDGDLNGRIWAIGPIAGYDYDALEVSDEDAEFVGHARTDIPLLLAVATAAAPMFQREPLVGYFHPLMGVQHFICPFCYADEQVYSDPFPHSKRCSWLRTKAALAPLLEAAE
jgi:hypothetical protein